MIDKTLAAFLEEGIAIQLATRNAHLEPNGVRVAAAKVDDDGTHVTAYVPKVAVKQVLPDLKSNGQVALVFTRPSDDRSCQVKGVFVSSHAPTARERALVDAQWNGFLTYLEVIGLPREAVESWTNWPAVAIRIRVTATFSQTPGPGAGAPLS